MPIFLLPNTMFNTLFYIYIAMKKIVYAIAIFLMLLGSSSIIASDKSAVSNFSEGHEKSSDSLDGSYEIQWEKDYGTLWWWSARYEGPRSLSEMPTMTGRMSC